MINSSFGKITMANIMMNMENNQTLSLAGQALCDSPDTPLQSLWWLGMLISMFGSFCSALGFNLQKKV
jgi:hypothetical protein